MSNFTQFISDISSFNTSVVLPFINQFFTESVGFIFVAVVCFVVVMAVLARLLKHKF